MVFTPPSPVALDLLQPLLSYMETILKTRGRVGLVSFCKDTRLALLHALSGEFPEKLVVGVPVYSDGYPKVLGLGLVEELRKDSTSKYVYLKLVFTCLYSTRALQLGKVPNVETIKGLASVPVPLVLDQHLDSFWRHLGYKPHSVVPSNLAFKKYHMSSKAGPNGQALWTSMVDLKLLVDSSLLEDLKVLGGSKFREIVDLLVSTLPWLPDKLFPVEGKTLRRLTYFPDKESKVRVVAILDYWSQTVLRPLHDYLFRVLRKIPQDCTFNQGSFTQKTQSWEYYYSYDLTAATDRFPIYVESMVLRGILPEIYVKSWESVMVGLPFDYTHNNKTEKIYYSVGNPMGAYSSWNSFALAHHYVMYWCCMELGISWETAKYCMLGDDVLIGDHNLASKYLEVMTGLGVNIAPLKSHTSTKLFEFAKRLFLDKVEVTPFPISAITEMSSRYYLLVSLLRQESKKGWLWSCSVPLAVSRFYSDVLGYNGKFCRSILDKSFACDVMIDIMNGTLTANQGLKTLIGWFVLPIPEMDDKRSKTVLSNLFQEIFTSKDPFAKLDYGQLAMDLVIAITSLPETEVGAARLDELPSKVPILNVLGQLEEKYLGLVKEVTLFEELIKGEWPMSLRALMLPISDKVFSERASRTITRLSASLATKTVEYLAFIAEEQGFKETVILNNGASCPLLRKPYRVA